MGAPTYPVRPLVVPSEQVLVVEDDLAGIRLADFLERRCPASTRMDLRHLVAAGRIKLNGVPCLHSPRLRRGDVVQVPAIEAAPRPEPPGPLPDVRYESSTVLVVAKPAGLATVPYRSGRDRGIHGRLDELRPGADLRIVHRLDRDTSGCLLLGKGLAAAQHFDEQFRNGAVAKTYLALVQGVPAPDRFEVSAWLGPDRRRPGKVVAAAGPARGLRSAHTLVEVLQRFQRYALLQLHPQTGRSHQLRVHLASVGHPIVGDQDYGGEALLLSSLKTGYKLRRGVVERPLLDRMFLHAFRVSFRDVDGTLVDVETPMTSDLAATLQKL